MMFLLVLMFDRNQRMAMEAYTSAITYSSPSIAWIRKNKERLCQTVHLEAYTDLSEAEVRKVLYITLDEMFINQGFFMPQVAFFPI